MKLKRTASVLICAGMLFSLTACDKDGKNNTDPFPMESNSAKAQGSLELSQEDRKATIPAGMQGLTDGYCGYYSENGYYDVFSCEDGDQNLYYTDFSTGQQRVLCAEPDCPHDNENCPGWLPEPGIRMMVPVGDKLVYLSGGSFRSSEDQGKQACGWIGMADPDGSSRKLLYQFGPGEWVPTLPRGGFARDQENLYFVLSCPKAGDKSILGTRYLYAANVNTQQVTQICELTEPEERIIGGMGEDLVLRYVPNAYDEDVKNSDLTEKVIRFDPRTGEETFLFEHPFQDVGECVNGRFIAVGVDRVIRSWDLETGELTSEQPVQFPREEELFGTVPMGFVDGRLLVRADFKLSEKETETDPLFYYGIDPATGEVFEIQHSYKGEDGVMCPCTVEAELGDELMIQSGQISKLVPYTDENGKKAKTQELIAQYSILSKDEFWNGTENGVPVQSAVK